MSNQTTIGEIKNKKAKTKNPAPEKLFNWADFGYDIHIGIHKPNSAYTYKDGKSRAEYMREWYRKRVAKQREEEGKNGKFKNGIGR